jgi:hypothetical protein
MKSSRPLLHPNTVHTPYTPPPAPSPAGGVGSPYSIVGGRSSRAYTKGNAASRSPPMRRPFGSPVLPHGAHRRWFKLWVPVDGDRRARPAANGVWVTYEQRKEREEEPEKGVVISPHRRIEPGAPSRCRDPSIISARPCSTGACACPRRSIRAGSVAGGCAAHGPAAAPQASPLRSAGAPPPMARSLLLIR